jgi:polyhydroxyalkanoate synthesis regulator phasin
MVLSKEAEMVKNLVAEGLLTPKNAEEFLEQIINDTANIERERNRMHRYFQTVFLSLITYPFDMDYIYSDVFVANK